MESPEHKRLDIVNQFNGLNFNKNKGFNDLVTLATEICNVPIAMITLMGEDIQWIKCAAGVEITENSRENSFCRYLVNKQDVMVVPDSLKDERFVNNPAVTSEAAVRFYAGAPLITNSGDHLGTLCVFDQKAQELSTKQKELLSILSRQVSNLMELEMNLLLVEKQKEKINTSERKLRAFFNSSSSCHILLCKQCKVLDFNKATAQTIKDKLKKTICVGKSMLDYITPGFTNDFLFGFKRALAGRKSHLEVLIAYNDVEIWWSVNFAPVKDDTGKIVSVGYNATNINDSRMQLAEITMQNESLSNIAYIQSHEYRRPVASILGLMNVIKEDNYESSKECLIMMEEAVKELDEKIKSVVHHTHYASLKS